MEFTETIQNENFIFTTISESNLLVTGKKCSYILYKSSTGKWRCADAIPISLLKLLGDAIDRNLGISPSINNNSSVN